MFRSWVIFRNSKIPGLYLLTETSLFTFSLITRDLNKIKKNPDHAFVDIIKKETSEKYQQKILNFMVVAARQSFRFFRQITWFLRNSRVLFKLRHWILDYWYSCFPVNFVKFLRTPFSQNTSVWLLVYLTSTIKL